jgi:hypothetical protein
LLTSSDGFVRQREITDRSGAYEFVRLPPGTYSLTASARGYLDLDFGEDVDKGGIQRIVLNGGDVFGSADFALPRGGVIAGRVVDELSKPIEHVPVLALAREYVAGQSRLIPASGAERSSDNQGEYRISDLPAGEYYVLASPGSFSLDGSRAAAGVPGYDMTFYPASSDWTGAQPVKLLVGQEAQNVDIVLTRSQTFSIKGRIIDSRGNAVAGKPLRLMPGEDVNVALQAQVSSGGDGSFTVHNLSSGTYVVQTALKGDPSEEFGAAVVTVPSTSPELILQTRPPLVSTGQVILEDGPPGFQPTDIQITATPVDFRRSPVAFGAEGEMKANWSFAITNIWGPQIVRTIRLPEGWGLKEVRVLGEDYTDRPIDFDTLRPTDFIQVILTSRPSGLAGHVLDSHGLPRADAEVIVFSPDASKWDTLSRFLRKTVTDSRGQFAFPVLPSARYLVVALDRVPRRRWRDPEALESLRAMATPVELGEAQQGQVTLTLKTFTGL